jgi:hypothetical protein
VLLVVNGIAIGLLTLTWAICAFGVVVCVALVADRASWAVRGALIGSIGGPAGRVRLRAYVNSMTQVGISVGAIIAGVAIAVASPAAYRLVILIDAGTLLVTAAMVMAIPGMPSGVAAVPGSRWIAFRDRRYLLFTVVNGVMSIQFDVFGYVLPLWIALRTSSPPWLFAAVILANTVAIALFQVATSRDSEQPSAAAKAMRRAGAAFLAACVLMALTGPLSSWAATVVIVLAVLVHTLGELWHNAGSFGLRYELAPDHAQGQYQGVFSVGTAGARGLSPLVLSAACIGLGATGWILVGLLLAIAGVLTPVVAALDAPRPTHQVEGRAA